MSVCQYISISYFLFNCVILISNSEIIEKSIFCFSNIIFWVVFFTLIQYLDQTFNFYNNIVYWLCVNENKMKWKFVCFLFTHEHLLFMPKILQQKYCLIWKFESLKVFLFLSYVKDECRAFWCFIIHRNEYKYHYGCGSIIFETKDDLDKV